MFEKNSSGITELSENSVHSLQECGAIIEIEAKTPESKVKA